MTDAMHKADERGKERKALKRAAHPEVRTKIQAKQRGKGRFGIRYAYRSRIERAAFVSKDIFEHWYVKERGRDQAFESMKRPCGIVGNKVIPSIYVNLEKISR